MKLALILTLMACSACLSFTAPKPYEATDEIKGRSRITGSSAYAEHPELLVGRVVTVRKDVSGACPTADRVFDTWTLSRKQYIKAPQSPPEQKTNVVYQVHSEVSAKVGGTFPFVGFDGSGEGSRELVVTDLSKALGKDNIDNAAIDQALAGNWGENICGRFLIENVVSSLSLTKFHAKVESKYSIVGSAFGLNGNIYSSNDEFKPEPLIFVDLIPIEPAGGLRPFARLPEAGNISVLLGSKQDEQLVLEDL